MHEKNADKQESLKAGNMIHSGNRKEAQMMGDQKGGKLTRRDFVKVTALGVGATALAGVGIKRAEAAVPKKWDKEVDVVVVGGGGAGLAAAISAHESGAKVLLIEKAPTFKASSTSISGGLFSCSNGKIHQKFGVNYPANKFYEDLLKWGLQTNIPELARSFADNSGKVIDWLVDMGLKVSKIEPPRVYPDPPKGSTIIDVVVKNLNDKQIPFMMQTKMNRLVMDYDKNQVLGVEAEKSKKKLYIRARKATILTTGGFGGNFDLYDRILVEIRGGYSCCSPDATGDGMLAGQKIGADVTHLFYSAAYAGGLDVNAGTRVQPLCLTPMHYFKIGGLYTNNEGKRFCDEGQPLSFVGVEYLPKQPNKSMFYIFDNVMYEKWRADQSLIFSQYQMEDIQKKSGKLVKIGNTIEALASKINVNPAVLKDTVTKFNSYVESKKDLEFQRTRGMDLKIEAPPFYAMGPIYSNVVLTLGGLRANGKAQVVDPFGNVIPGLYVAGEIMGGVHGSRYYGGTAVGKAFTFGYLAGKYAADEKQRK